MNYLNHIEEIISLLNANGFGDLANELSDQQMSCATGGELLSSICAKILSIKEEYPKAFETITTQANTLICYANCIGMYPMAVSPKRIVSVIWNATKE